MGFRKRASLTGTNENEDASARQELEEAHEDLEVQNKAQLKPEAITGKWEGAHNTHLQDTIVTPFHRNEFHLQHSPNSQLALN